jgi:hypothetical protein
LFNTDQSTSSETASARTAGSGHQRTIPVSSPNDAEQHRLAGTRSFARTHARNATATEPNPISRLVSHDFTPPTSDITIGYTSTTRSKSAAATRPMFSDAAVADVRLLATRGLLRELLLACKYRRILTLNSPTLAISAKLFQQAEHCETST